MLAQQKVLLCVDIGNSNIAIGAYVHSELASRWRLSTRVDKTADEYEIDIRALLGLATRDSMAMAVMAVSDAVISSVVPSLTATLAQTCRNLSGKDPLVVTPATRTGLTFEIDNPREIGSDLIANAVAGLHRYRSNCIIVDFGTALSFTVVTADARLLGVSIAPGVHAAMDALSRNTDQLPHVPLVMPSSAIGKNTIHAIQSGVLFGYLGLVEALIGRIKEEVPGGATVVATGGLSQLLAPNYQLVDHVEPWLTLDGLRLLAEMNGWSPA
ncbi:MAG TPA: type III pantothenate kinase [Spirochaetia bacterium]|nr:type III pantothenate kinase [Spirochaetia bacterium]